MFSNDDEIEIKNICKMNIVKYDDHERAIVSITNPKIGIVVDDKCYDIASDKLYPIIKIDDNNLVISNNEKKAYIFNYPFENIEETISYEYLKNCLITNKMKIENIKIFHENKISEFKYKLYKKKFTSLGYCSLTDGNMYDLENDKMIDSDNIYYRNLPFRKSNNTVSINEIKKLLILKNRMKKQK